MDNAKIVNGMFRITDYQKQLLKELNEVVVKINKEVKKDSIFNEFINTLGVFDYTAINLEEISGILIQNSGDEIF